MNTNIIDALKWRYATKKFDPSKKLSPEQLEIATESLRLSASSFGLQPWKFIHVINPEIRAQLRAAAWDQTQVTDASELFVLAVNTKVDVAYIDRFVATTAEVRGVPVEKLKGYGDMMQGSLAVRTPEQVIEWSTRQVYVALGTALTALASQGIDACPMEGFDSGKFDEILGLQKLGLQSRVILTIGFRSEDDAMSKATKVRFCKEEAFIEVK